MDIQSSLQPSSSSATTTDDRDEARRPGKQDSSATKQKTAATIHDISETKQKISETKELVPDQEAQNAMTPIIGRRSALHDAARDGPDSTVQMLLDNGADVAAIDINGRTALHDAARRGSDSTVQMLLDNGADVAAIDIDGRTALHDAAKAASDSAIKILLHRGADVNAVDKHGRNASHKAALHKVTRDRSDLILQMLLDNGADVAAIDIDGRTALHDAARAASISAVQILLLSRADVNAVDKHGRSALYEAFRSRSDSTILTLLDKGADMHASDHGGRTLLHDAARAGEVLIVSYLLNSGANAHAVDREGRSILHDAVYAGSHPVAVRLIRERVHIDALDINGRTALHEAARFGGSFSERIIQTLLDGGADLHARDHNGYTALHEAARFGGSFSERIIQTLLSGGADLHARDHNGYTALHEAARFGGSFSERIIQTLLGGGADLHARDHNGRTALHEAARFSGSFSERIIQTLLGGGADLHARDHNGRTALHEAARFGGSFSKRIIQTLLSGGADLHARDHNGRTALHEAALSDCDVALMTLIDEGAEIDARDKNGRTALHDAADGECYWFSLDLIQHGADINLVDHRQRSALSTTLDRGNLRTVISLLRSGARTDISWNHAADNAIFEDAENEWLESKRWKFNHAVLMKLMAMLAPHLEAAQEATPRTWRHHIYCEWEVPKTMREIAERDTKTTSTALEHLSDMLAKSVVLTGANNAFDCSRCGDYLEKTWGQVGLAALRLVSHQLEAMLNPASTQPTESDVQAVLIPVKFATATNNYIAITLEDPTYDSTSFEEAMQWLCSAVRPHLSLPNTSNKIPHGLQRSKVSTTKTSVPRCRLFECSLVKLEPLTAEEIGSHNCWVPLFQSGVIAWWSIDRKWGAGIELPFDMLIDFAAVENCAVVPPDNDQSSIDTDQRSGGCILTGYFTALIPIDQDPSSGSIQWHIEYSDEIIHPRELLLNRSWLRIQDHTSFERARCFLGWGNPVDVLLGTKDVGYNIRWSGTDEHRIMRRAEGTVFGAELGLGGSFPVSPKVSVEREYKMHNVVQRFTRQSQYDKAIVHLSKQVGLVLDAPAERAWLVPLLSLMLHLCHAYYARFNTDPDSEDPIPFATAQPDGAMAAIAALKGQRDQPVLGSITLGNILLDIHTNMNASAGQSRDYHSGRTIFASEVMDQLNEPMSGSPLMSTKLGPECLAWLSLVQLADYVCFCGNLGPAMQPQHKDPNETCQCHVLPQHRSFLAAHNSCLEILMEKKGVNLKVLQDGIWMISKTEFLSVKDWHFTPCTHDPVDPFWSNSARLLQTSHSSFTGTRGKQKAPKLAEPPPRTGAVVFGSPPPAVLKKKRFLAGNKAVDKTC